MKKIDIASLVCNVILGILYLPIAVFSFLMLMVSEAKMDANNPLFIALIDIFCVVSFLVPFLLLAGIILSLVFRIKGRSVASLVIQFVPVAILLMNFLLLGITDMIPSIL